jgi:sugar phosphate isomerase/epimerase
MRISILSDEISVDPVAACELAADWGLKHLEFRLWMTTRAPHGMTDADMQRVRQTADSFGLDFPSVSPGLFKLKLDDPAYADHCGAFQDRCYDLAEALGAKIVVLFPPICGDHALWFDWPARVVDDLRQAAANAATRGLLLALENEPICYGGSGPALAKLIAAINHPNMKANWDPGNHSHATGEDFRAGYEALRPVHIHTHVKDYRREEGLAISRPGAIVPGDGDVNWLGQLQALRQDGYTGLLVLETHFQPKIAGSRACVERLRELLAQIGEEA